MNKTAIKNFAIWARNKLIADISYRAGLMGITENGIKDPLPQSNREMQFFDIGTAEPYAISGGAIRQREKLVSAIEQKAKSAKYEIAYKNVMEEVAYTWFNRLIAIRFMEINDYMPAHVRVLSSDSGKMEPDIVTTPFEAELDFTEAERQNIIALKTDNRLDELFRLLFIKQCNALNAYLPALFEKTEDYTELLLNLSVIDQDGVVYHLVHDIDEADFDISQGGQVEIIGWLYQYYNTEPKAEAFAQKEKIRKDQIPAVTQLFTPDWIVRYMVENSLGRLWLEGHPQFEEQFLPSEEERRCYAADHFFGVDSRKWYYYLEEAEQEPEVQAQLAEIRKEYAQISPEDIRVIDPCMGSGHILVYCFDVLMQIYEAAGYSKRDAAKLILEHNIYGLDIDDRAFQLAYFALMMRARQYNRRILSAETVCHVHSICESNGVNRGHLKYFGADLSTDEKEKALNQMQGLIGVLHDAKEYGSILNVEAYDWNLLRRFVENEDSEAQVNIETVGIEKTQELLKDMIEVGEALAQKYHVVVTNPPYMAISNGNGKLNEYVKKNYPDSKTDLFAVFIERCEEMTKKNHYQAMITMHAWMFLSSFENLRGKLLTKDTVNMVHLGARAFEEIGGEVVQTTSFVLRKGFADHYKGVYCRLIEPASQVGKEEMFLRGENRYTAAQCEFGKIPGKRFAYWIDGNKIFGQNSIKKWFFSGGRNKTHNNDLYVRIWWEIGDSPIMWRHYDNGGYSIKWYGNCLDIVNWSEPAKDFYAMHGGLLKDDMCLKMGISWNGVSGKNYSFKIKQPEYAFSSSSPTIITDDLNKIYATLAILNSCVAPYILNAVNPTLQLNVGEVLDFPIIELPIDTAEIADNSVKIAKADWDSFETSWDFARHPLVRPVPTIADAYTAWQCECNERFAKLKSNEEELNRIFIEIYGLQEELTPEVDAKDVTVHYTVDEKEDAPAGMEKSNYLLTRQDMVKSLISYAVGCMFGRYSLDIDGLAYAGGTWKEDYYNTFIPDEDDIIPITDEEYFEDDIVGLFCGWLKKVYGVDTLEENLDFIAKSLGNKGNTSREVIRNYFLTDFVKDHMRTYQKRPIYWLFDAGKQNGFKCLIYLHRYTPDTIGKIRADYLHRMQRTYENEIDRMQDVMDNSTNSREVGQATKRKEKLQKQLKECREYDEMLGHLALSRISLDLDDGVKVNYRKLQTGSDGKLHEILADSKNIMAKE